MSADIGGPAQPLLTITGLKKHFPLKRSLLGRSNGTVRAVDGITFELRKGETLGVVGESGCGKSTTARLLMHLIDPTTEKRLNDVAYHSAPEVEERLSQAGNAFADDMSYSLNP